MVKSFLIGVLLSITSFQTISANEPEVGFEFIELSLKNFEKNNSIKVKKVKGVFKIGSRYKHFIISMLN